MSSSNHRLPDDVVEVARRGNFIEAIKLLRAATGLGLKESKELIDAFKRGDADASAGKVGVDAILGSALAAMRSGSRPEAIKLL
ncbi:MAG: ribosomal protein L7/L12, partial [Lysobacterales bacterium]